MPYDKYIGYQPTDYQTPYAKFYDETIEAIPAHIEKALQVSPLPAGTLPPLSKIADLLKDGYTNVESGYSLEKDGSVQVVCLTNMPNVSPKMWHWWFGWHGDLDNKYKLWHPKMHVSATWQDGQGNNGQYIGRTSVIQEYITPNKLEKANIQFISPLELGLSNDLEKQIFICARLGYTHYPVDFGWLVHQVRATTEGSEMRSRFFMGGSHIQLRMGGWLPQMVSKLLQKVVRLPKEQGHDLLVHCAEEMRHLAAFLPSIYQEFHSILSSRTLQGRLSRRLLVARRFCLEWA